MTNLPPIEMTPEQFAEIDAMGDPAAWPGAEQAGPPDGPPREPRHDRAGLPDRTDLGAELLGIADSLARRARGRDVAAAIADADLDMAALGDWRDFLAKNADLPRADYDVIIREAKAQRKADVGAATRAAWAARKKAALDAAAKDGALMPEPNKPLDVARHLAPGLPNGARSHAWWREDFYSWTGTHWIPTAASMYRRHLYLATENAVYADDKHGTAAWAPTPVKVAQVLDALATVILQRDPAQDPVRCIALRNGVLDLARGLQPHDPARFNLASLPHIYDAGATCPSWLAFLGSCLPGDAEAVTFLQEWFGYVLSGRTDLQKMANLVGRPRCGKGTIARVLRALLGPENVAMPELSKLATQFGEQGLIGKTLAVLGDVRWNTRTAADAVPVLLGISGEDARSIPRKNQEDWNGQLGVRFMLMSNDAPTFTDASAALASRMVHVEFTQSFLGREDLTLEGRLMAELPGILNWSLEGLRRLTTRGRFAPPASAQAMAEDVRRMASPVGAFVDDCCTITGPTWGGEGITAPALYGHYRAWCEREGRTHPEALEVFIRNLKAAHRGQVATERKRTPQGRTTIVTGVDYTGPNEFGFDD